MPQPRDVERAGQMTGARFWFLGMVDADRVWHRVDLNDCYVVLPGKGGIRDDLEITLTYFYCQVSRWVFAPELDESERPPPKQVLVELTHRGAQVMDDWRSQSKKQGK